MEIVLNKDQWYVRWFFWSLGIWADFKDSFDEDRVESRGTNLCYFVRVTFIWAPLVLLLNVVVYGAAIASLTAVPVYLFGLALYISFIVAFVTVGGIVWGAKLYQTRQHQQIQEATPVELESVTVPPAASNPGFFETLWKYIVAAKQKVCPTITFDQQQGSVS